MVFTILKTWMLFKRFKILHLSEINEWWLHQSLIQLVEIFLLPNKTKQPSQLELSHLQSLAGFFCCYSKSVRVDWAIEKVD